MNRQQLWLVCRKHSTITGCNPASIMHGKVTLKNLDEVDANYGLLACALKYGKKDAAFLQYATDEKLCSETFKKKSATRTDGTVNRRYSRPIDLHLQKQEAEVRQTGRA